MKEFEKLIMALYKNNYNLHCPPTGLSPKTEKHITEGKIGGSSISHSLENSVWKRLWTCRERLILEIGSSERTPAWGFGELYYDLHQWVHTSLF
jgi:hypothetical protein